MDTFQANTAFAGFAEEQEAGTYRLTLSVEGIHCASCVRLIEQALAENSSVIDARVNLTTERLALIWSGSQSLADTLCEKVQSLGYKLHPIDEGARQSEENQNQLLKVIAVSGFAAANMMLISISLWSSDAETMGLATRDFFHWVSALIALPTMIYAGQPFFRSAYGVLRAGHTNMDVPISLAVILAGVMSVSETLRGGDYVYFDSAVMLLFFLLIGRYLDARAKGRARQNAQQLLSHLQGFATKLLNGEHMSIAIKDIKVGDRLLVAAGETIPADGKIAKGQSSLDMSLINGETMPQSVEPGTNVFAGTLNIDAPIEMHVSEISDKSLLSEIVRLMETAEQSNARYVRLADQAARLYTPLVHSLGALTYLGWWLLAGSPWQVALLHAVTVLIITCPCALGLAVPVVQVVASSRLMKAGILLKSGDALERLATIDTVIFDKTGTLTEGRPDLFGGDYTNEQLKIAASMARMSRHPLSKALTRHFTSEALDCAVTEIPGKGLESKIGQFTYRLGSRTWCGAPHDTESEHIELWLAQDEQPVACFSFKDTLRADAKPIIDALKGLGLTTHLLSGDRKAVAVDVGDKLGIQNIISDVSPVDKTDYINQLKAEGRRVLMVGDGLNDAPALAAADVSMSPSSAIDIAQNTADIVYQGATLSPVPLAIRTAKKSTRLVKQNFALAALYNAVAIPLAVAGFVTPLVAAIAMSGSSLIVILNAFRLKSERSE